MELLKEHITAALCASVFVKVRHRQRQRKGTLWLLVRFWIEVILRAPASRSQALVDAPEGRMGLVCGVATTDQAFFQRSQKLRWEFFAELFHRFVGTMSEAVPGAFSGHWTGLRERFPDVLAIDGSRLASVARRLKILQNGKAVVLPGCLIAGYDLFRGFPRLLRFCGDATKAKMTRAQEALPVLGEGRIRAGSLLIGDRWYCTAD